PSNLGFASPRSRSPPAIAKRSLKRILHCQLRRLQSLSMSLAVLDDLSADELGTKLKEYSITATDTKNPLSDPYPFNLMFQTSIGPSGPSPGKSVSSSLHLVVKCLTCGSRYMRPETAQGIFINFKDLYYYNGNKLLFAAAQIGQAFRNEVCQCYFLLIQLLSNHTLLIYMISPCHGLLRAREFTLVEIEHF
ncbi:unnamed protein product, partial [Musa hybrid cultivar]